jgi:putative flavoprotein involved in K+ transport
MKMITDVIVIGGGQSGLACGYFLKRSGLSFLILDRESKPGGAWLHGWESLTLFSPAESSTLPGWPMPKSKDLFPSRMEVIDYLTQYELRYELPVTRNVNVLGITLEEPYFKVETETGNYFARAIISATGTWGKPIIPNLKGRELFTGIQIHSAHYVNAESFRNKKVLVVGEGNSGAQILAEVSKVASAKWATRSIPHFLPDDVDGRVLFNLASAKYQAQKEGKPFDASKYNLGNVVMVPSVKEARDRNVLHAAGSVAEVSANGVIWDDGTMESFDVIIWCTGFGYSTQHLQSIFTLDEKGKTATEETRSMEVPGIWLVGYGGWTGFASSTLIGVGRTARVAVQEIQAFLASK